MGCDIHTFREVRHAGQWHSVDRWSNPGGWPLDSAAVANPLDDGRGYAFFGALARGVRSYQFDYSCDAKGLPEDVSERVGRSATWWDADAHTHSWLTLAELKVLQARVPEGCDVGLGIRARLTSWIEDLGGFEAPSDGDVRVVFWFDN